MKQEPRPAYHRRRDLERLQQQAQHAQNIPLIVVDLGATHGYEVRTTRQTPLHRGRFEVIMAYLKGWTHAHDLRCTDYRPDHNGECLNCDEGPDAHPLPSQPPNDQP